MATNSSRGNPIAARDAPPVETGGPPISPEVKSAIHSALASNSDLTKAEQHAPGQDSTTTTTATTTTTNTTSSTTSADADMRREMEGLGRSEVAKRGGETS